MPAYDRLPRAQQRNLRSIAASMAMEDMAPSAEQLEILALHMLGEIDAAERTRRLDALLRRSLKTNRVEHLPGELDLATKRAAPATDSPSQDEPTPETSGSRPSLRSAAIS